MSGSLETSRRNSKESSRSTKREERKPLKEKEGNLDAVEVSYNYKAPYQQDCGGEKSVKKN